MQVRLGEIRIILNQTNKYKIISTVGEHFVCDLDQNFHGKGEF